MKLLKLLQLLLLLIPAIFLHAQEDCLPNPYPFFSFDRNSGLISNRVNCIAQDHAGFWWFGTVSGLQQFDGHTFRTYPDLPGDSVQLRTSILALYPDRSKRFWVVTNSGIFQMDTSTGRFVPSAIKAEKKPTLGFPSRMMEDSRGDLWLASSITLPGLFRLRAGSKTWEAVPLPEGTTIIARNIQEDPQTGHIWVMFLEPGKRAAFGYIDYRTEKLIPAPAALQAEVREATHFSIDGENNFWTSTTANNWTGLHVVRYGNISGTAERYNMKILPFNPLFTDRKGRFWYFAEKRAYFGYYDQKSGTFKRFFWPIAFNNNASLNDDTLNDFFEDREGNIWIASKEGVFVFNPDKAVISPAHAIRKGQGNSKIAPALGIMQTADAKIWAGTFFNGTFLMGRDFQEIKKYLHPIPPGYVAPDAARNFENFNAIWVFHEDRKGNIWAGGQGGVVIQFSPSGDVLWKGHFRERTIRCITSDEKGNIWLGTQGGVLGKLDPETRVFQTVFKVPQEENKPIPRLLQILPNRDNLVWLVYNDRILCFNVHTGKALPLNNRPEKGSIGMLPPSATAYAITWNDSSFIVVGSAIHWFDKSRRLFRPVSSSNDIAALGIKSAVRDGEALWLIHSSGMVRWSPKTGKTVKYDMQDGVPIQFNETENAAIRLSDGRILAAWGSAGFIVFHPDSLRLTDSPPPQVRITGLSAMGKPLSFNPYSETSIPFRFKHSQNFLTVRYACLSWQQRHHLRFRYRILGYSKKWVDNGRQRSISLAGLSPGRYVLEIEVQNRERQTATANTRFPLRVLPPWYLSWPALLGYVLLIGFLGYHFYRFQLKRKMEASKARQLQEMDTFKTNFYTNITHEFRTPLTVIEGMAEQIQASPEKYLNTGISMIRRNSSRLLQLVNQVLELSRLESGKLQVQRQRGDVGAFIQYIFESFTSFAGTKGISLSLEKQADIPIMDFDPEKIQTVLGNLLSNAIKFTPTGGRITGSVQIFPTEKAPGGIGRMTGIDAREYFAVCVQDTGKGISQEELGRIFERYYQAEGSPSAGSGVGLTLARELARLMGGDVTAASKPGEGSAFTLWLPVLQLAADLPPVQVQSAGRPISYDDDAAWPIEPKTVKTRPTLLLVEDSPDVLYYLSVSLSPWYNLLSARNGKEGLKKALETVPDLVISDIMMPEMDGLEFCAQLKNDVHISHIPVILLTARAGLPDKIEGLDRGADAYLVKPFDRGELLAQVRQLLEQRKRLQVYYRRTAVGDTGNQHEEHNVPKPGVDEQFLVQLRETLAARLSDPNFSATDLERALGMSHAQLFRKMKALLGYSANTLIRKMRIRKAQELLGKQEMSIAEVAYAVGFKEPAYFSKVFKDETGVAPGEWLESTG